MKITTRSIRQFLITTAIMTLALIAFNAFGANIGFAQSGNPIDAGRDVPGGLEAIGGGEGSLRAIVKTILNFFLSFLGLLAVIMVIYGGFLYVGSAGNEENVNKAKKILLYAAIGIIVIVVSFAVVNTLLTSVGTGTPT